MANHQAFIGTTVESPQINEEKEYEECLALLTKFDPNFKKFVNKPTGNFRAQSYQQPQHYHQNSGNFQGGNKNQQSFNSQNLNSESYNS